MGQAAGMCTTINKANKAEDVEVLVPRPGSSKLPGVPEDVERLSSSVSSPPPRLESSRLTGTSCTTMPQAYIALNVDEALKVLASGYKCKHRPAVPCTFDYESAKAFGKDVVLEVDGLDENLLDRGKGQILTKHLDPKHLRMLKVPAQGYIAVADEAVEKVLSDGYKCRHRDAVPCAFALEDAKRLPGTLLEVVDVDESLLDKANGKILTKHLEGKHFRKPQPDSHSTGGDPSDLLFLHHMAGGDDDDDEHSDDDTPSVASHVGSFRVGSRRPCKFGMSCRHCSQKHFDGFCHPWNEDHPDFIGKRWSCRFGESCTNKKLNHRLSVAHVGDSDYVEVDASLARSSWSLDSDIPDGQELNKDQVAAQEAHGAQSERGGWIVWSDAALGACGTQAHAKSCFEAMRHNEKRYCGKWVAFYHSYSDAGLIYEVQSAIAAVLFGFKSEFGTLPRLMRGRFSECPDAPAMVKLWPTWPDRDHNPLFKSVGICATSNLLDTSQPEAPPTKVFLQGYSVGCPGAIALVTTVLTTCGVATGQAAASAKDIVNLAAKYGMNVDKSGGGHMLQMFIKRHLVNKYVYASFEYGKPDPSRDPYDVHANGGGFVTGQVRIVCHPSLFLFNRKARCFTYSANKTFHDGRQKFQEELTNVLSLILGDEGKRKRAAEGVFGGSLPIWYVPKDMRRPTKE